MQIHNQQRNEYVSMQKWVYPPALMSARKQCLDGRTIDSVCAEETASRWAHYWMIGQLVVLTDKEEPTASSDIE